MNLLFHKLASPPPAEQGLRLGIDRSPWRLVDDCADDSIPQGSQRAQPLLELSLRGAAPFHHDQKVVKDLPGGAHIDRCRKFGQIEDDPLIAAFTPVVDGVEELPPQQVEIVRTFSTRQKIEVRTNVAYDHIVESGLTPQ